MKYLVITRFSGMSEIIDEDIRDRFEVRGVQEPLVGNVYKNPLILFDCNDLVTDDILGHLCTRIDCPSEEVKVYNLLTKKNLKDTTRRLIEDEIKQSEEFIQMKKDFADRDKKVNIELHTKTLATNHSKLKISSNTELTRLTDERHVKQLDAETKALNLIDVVRDTYYRAELIGDAEHTKEIEKKLVDAVQEYFEIIKDLN